MTTSAFIQDHRVVNPSCVRVVATVTDADGKFESKSCLDALRKATGHKLMPVPNSFAVCEQGKTRKVISGYMSLSKEVIPLSENQEPTDIHGFQAFSSNMFMDDNEKLWELKAGQNGRNLILAHTESTNDEIETLMASVSSDAFSSMSNALSSISHSLDNNAQQIANNDFIAFVNESSELEQAIVIGELENDVLLVATASGEKEISRYTAAHVVHANQLEYTMPSMEATAGVGQTERQKLTDYYTKLFDYNHSYRDKILAIVNGHAFC